MSDDSSTGIEIAKSAVSGVAGAVTTTLITGAATGGAVSFGGALLGGAAAGSAFPHCRNSYWSCRWYWNLFSNKEKEVVNDSNTNLNSSSIALLS